MEFADGSSKAGYKHRLLLLLDEFTSLGKLPIMENVLVFFMLQNCIFIFYFQYNNRKLFPLHVRSSLTESVLGAGRLAGTFLLPLSLDNRSFSRYNSFFGKQ
jgi:hypothetical protein